MYRDERLLGSEYFGNLMLKSEKKDVFRYNGQREVGGYTRHFREAIFVFGQEWGNWRLGLGPRVTTESFSKLESFRTKPPQNESLGTRATLEYSDISYQLYFKEGLRSKLKWQGEWLQWGSGRKAQSLLLKTKWQTNPVSDHALQLTSTQAINFNPSPEDVFYRGDTRGFRGINDSGLWAEAYAGLALDYQIPLYHFSSGVWTVAPFVEGTYLDHFQEESLPSLSSSTGLGSYFYLKEIALPGMGLVAGYNPSFEKTFLSFFIGGRF